MAKDLSNAEGIGNDTDFLNGNIVDKATKVNAHIFQDIAQFFQKLMNKAGLTANGDFDNEVNDYQFIEALDNRNNDYFEVAGGDVPLAAVQFSMNIVFDNPGQSYNNTYNYPYDQTLDVAKFTGVIALDYDDDDTPATPRTKTKYSEAIDFDVDFTDPLSNEKSIFSIDIGNGVLLGVFVNQNGVRTVVNNGDYTYRFAISLNVNGIKLPVVT